MSHKKRDRAQIAAHSEGEPVRVGIPYPPDDIFKFKRTRVNPSEDVWGRGSVTYIPVKADYLKGKGTFVHYVGTAFPSRCVAPVQAIHATNTTKRILISAFKVLSMREAFLPLSMLILMGKKRRTRLIQKSCEQVVALAEITVYPYYLEDDYYCPLAQEIRKFVKNFLCSLGVQEEVASKCGEVIGMMFEYDNAYRFRIQDIAGETTKEALLNDFPQEIERLLNILASREVIPQGEVAERFRSGAKILKYIWYTPLRWKFKKAMEELDIERCRMEEGDEYHTLLFGDYNVKGRNIEERLKVYENYHGEDRLKWPPRIMIRSNALA